MYADFVLKIKKEIEIRRTIYKFKDEDSLKKFKIMTSNTDAFTKCFKDNKPFLQQAKHWEKNIKYSYCKVF